MCGKLTAWNSENTCAGEASWTADYGGTYRPPGGNDMVASTLAQAPVSKRSRAEKTTSHGNGSVGLPGSAHARGTIPSIRMRLLHLENALGAADRSEYSLDAMVSLVLLIARSASLKMDRMARHISGIHVPCPVQGGLVPAPATVRQAVSVQRAG